MDCTNIDSFFVDTFDLVCWQASRDLGDYVLVAPEVAREAARVRALQRALASPWLYGEFLAEELGSMRWVGDKVVYLGPRVS